LYGIEINEFAVNQAQKRLTGINIIKGSAFDIPFKDKYFDLVYTAGVLIHISSSDVSRAIAEINRCSKKYIWGFEYYSDAITEADYRGNANLFMEGGFREVIYRSGSEIEIGKEKKYKYIQNENVDFMYLP